MDIWAFLRSAGKLSFFARTSLTRKRRRPWPEGVSGENNYVRDKFLHRGFCTSAGTRIWGRILRNEFWAPEFWTRILGLNVITLFFPAREASRKNSLQKIHLPEFTFQNSTPEIGPKNSHCTSAGAFGWNYAGKLRADLYYFLGCGPLGFSLVAFCRGGV